MNVFPLYYGKEKGFFLEQGIDLEIEYLHGGPELVRAVQEGKIQVGTIGLPPFSKAFAEGLPAKIVGSAIMRQLNYYVVARPEIQTMTDLKGKKIGILSFGSCDEYFIRRMLKMEGVNPNTEIELVSLGEGYGDLNCFAVGQIDAGFIGEPKVTQGEHLGLFKVLARVGDYFPKYQWGVIFARNDFIEQQPELLAIILEGFRNACRYIQENPEETIELGSKLFDVSTEVFRGALHRDLANWEVDAKVDIEGLNNCLKIQAEAGAITCDIGNLEMVCRI
jgi:ABC-type nitrate/sulfonate/bicarbonate transport system substrate-binding protein